MNGHTKLTHQPGDASAVWVERVGASSVLHLGDGASIEFPHGDRLGEVLLHVKALMRGLSQVEINDREAQGERNPIPFLRQRRPGTFGPEGAA